MPDWWSRGGLPEAVKKATLPKVREEFQETLRQQIEAAAGL